MPSHRVNDESLLVAHYPFSGHARDVSGHGYDGTLVNTPTWGTFLNGRGSIEFDGNNQHVNLGRIVELDNAPAFTMTFWMKQDVLKVADYIFYRWVDWNNCIMFTTDANGVYILFRNAGNTDIRFDYAGLVFANDWAHMAAVFDGSQTGNAERFKLYINSVPVTLTFAGSAVPATAPDLSTVDANIGAVANAFDGELYDFRIFSAALSRDEILSIIHGPVPFLV